jgi:hypothetical protein
VAAAGHAATLVLDIQKTVPRNLLSSMKTLSNIIVLCAALGTASSAFGAQSLCTPLQEFVRSVKPGELREFTFQTSWGGDFKDSSESPSELVMSAKRCIDHGYAPAKKVCEYLLEHGAAEFAGNNVKEALTCLSPKTHFASMVALNRGCFSLSFGAQNRGALIEMEFYEDQEIGGMAFKFSANGY